MADTFDPYREALVMETRTVWPASLGEVDLRQRQRVEEALHADPAQCGEIEYVRVHSGFCRTITVTAEDLERVGA